MIEEVEKRKQKKYTRRGKRGVQLNSPCPATVQFLFIFFYSLHYLYLIVILLPAFQGNFFFKTKIVQRKQIPKKEAQIL